MPVTRPSKKDIELYQLRLLALSAAKIVVRWSDRIEVADWASEFIKAQTRHKEMDEAVFGFKESENRVPVSELNLNRDPRMKLLIEIAGGYIAQAQSFVASS